MRKYYNKLIRDRIPEIMTRAGVSYALEALNDEAYLQALKAKLVEEAQEAEQAEPGELLKELADLCAVINTLLETSGHSWDELQERETERRQQRGGFEKRLKLLWTERD